MKKLGFVFPALLLTLFCNASRADVKILNFQVGGLMTFSGGADSLSIQGAWTPIFDVGPIGVRGEIGISPIKPAGVSMMLTNYEAFLRFSMAPTLTLEAGGGFKKSGSSSLQGCLSGGLAISLMGFLDRIYGTYSRILPGGGSNEIRFGLGINI